MNKFLQKRSPVTFLIRGFVTLLIPSVLTVSGLAKAGDENHASVAIEGYDPVAYFTLLKAVKGSEEFSYQWLSDTWHFMNNENRELFIGDPMRFMPNYGGYCSFDPVSAGHDHEIDPTVWNIVNDKLYLYYSEEIAGQELKAHEWAQVKAGLSKQNRE